MAISGFPTVTGQVLTSSTMNSLVQFDVVTQTGDYTATTNDNYQEIFLMNKATAIAFKLPTNATTAFPIGTVLTVLNIGAGTCTISAVTPGTTTVLSAGATAASPTIAQYKSAACIKTGTDAWYVVGAIG
jgi:hypothetical protein